MLGRFLLTKSFKSFLSSRLLASVVCDCLRYGECFLLVLPFYSFTCPFRLLFSLLGFCTFFSFFFSFYNGYRLVCKPSCIVFFCRWSILICFKEGLRLIWVLSFTDSFITHRDFCRIIRKGERWVFLNLNITNNQMVKILNNLKSQSCGLWYMVDCVVRLAWWCICCIINCSYEQNNLTFINLLQLYFRI